MLIREVTHTFQMDPNDRETSVPQAVGGTTRIFLSDLLTSGPYVQE